MCYSANIQMLNAKPQPETVFRLTSFVSHVNTTDEYKFRRTVALYESPTGDFIRRVFIASASSPLASIHAMIPQRITTKNCALLGV